MADKKHPYEWVVADKMKEQGYDTDQFPVKLKKYSASGSAALVGVGRTILIMFVYATVMILFSVIRMSNGHNNDNRRYQNETLHSSDVKYVKESNEKTIKDALDVQLSMDTMNLTYQGEKQAYLKEWISMDNDRFRVILTKSYGVADSYTKDLGDYMLYVVEYEDMKVGSTSDYVDSPTEEPLLAMESGDTLAPLTLSQTKDLLEDASWTANLKATNYFYFNKADAKTGSSSMNPKCSGKLVYLVKRDEANRPHHLLIPDVWSNSLRSQSSKKDVCDPNQPLAQNILVRFSEKPKMTASASDASETDATATDATATDAKGTTDYIQLVGEPEVEKTDDLMVVTIQVYNAKNDAIQLDDFTLSLESFEEGNNLPR